MPKTLDKKEKFVTRVTKWEKYLFDINRSKKGIGTKSILHSLSCIQGIPGVSATVW